MFLYSSDDKCYSNLGNKEMVDNWGYVVHTDCLTCVREVVPDLSFNMIHIDEEYTYIADSIDYGELEDFQNQYCSIHAIHYHNPNYLKSPLINTFNKNRIVRDILPQII